MRGLAELLRGDLGYIYGERECGPNGNKRTFLNTGRTFLRTLSKDLGLTETRIDSAPGGIAVSGDCTLRGMWGRSGIYIQLGQILINHEYVVLYRTIQNIRDFCGGRNNFLTRRDLERMSYRQLLDTFWRLRKEEDAFYECAA